MRITSVMSRSVGRRDPRVVRTGAGAGGGEVAIASQRRGLLDLRGGLHVREDGSQPCTDREEHHERSEHERPDEDRVLRHPLALLPLSAVYQGTLLGTQRCRLFLS